MVFKSMVVDGDTTTHFTLLEFHEWENDVYVITNELYKSDDPDTIGTRVPLSDEYEELQEETRITGLSRPLFNYFKPKGFNNISPHSPLDRKSTRLNSSHVAISYAVFCLKKKKKT